MRNYILSSSSFVYFLFFVYFSGGTLYLLSLIKSLDRKKVSVNSDLVLFDIKGDAKLSKVDNHCHDSLILTAEFACEEELPELWEHFSLQEPFCHFERPFGLKRVVANVDMLKLIRL